MQALPSGLSLEIVQQFVHQYPEKAVDILIRYCQDQRIQNEIVSYVLQPKKGPYGASSPPNSLNITLSPPLRTSSLNSHHSGSPPPRLSLPQRPPSDARSYAPLSPPSSSVTSRSSKGESAPGQYILLLTFSGESGVDEQLVRMRTEPVKQSLIREDVIHTRKLNDSLSTSDEYQVFVPHSDTAVSVSLCAKLTWRRPHSNSTHSTTFYVVPRGILDIDIVLGYADSGEGASEYPPTVAPQPQRGQGYTLEEINRSLPPAAPTPPAHSFHRSTLMYDGSISATPVQQHQQFVESLMARQHAHGAAMEDSRLSHHSSAATVLGGSRSSRIEHPQPLRPPTSPASFHSINQSAPTDKIRLYFVWDKTPMNVWLDPHAPGEAFFKVFQQLVESRKGIFDRSTITIYLKKDKQTPDDEAYALCLDENDLDADWDTTVTWLEENKKEKSPHIYGRVQVGEG